MTGTSEVIVREVFIDASPEEVFPYFTDAAKMVVWKRRTAAPRAGSTIWPALRWPQQVLTQGLIRGPASPAVGPLNPTRERQRWTPNTTRQLCSVSTTRS
jgi:hypothetical protein